MDLKELVDYLHAVFGGSDKHNSKVEEILEKSTLDKGLKKAYEYYKWAKEGQKNCQSDWAYWAWEGDITLSKVLIAITLRLRQEWKTFPQFPTNRFDLLMNQTAQAEEWAHNLISDHEHDYEQVYLRHGEKDKEFPDGCPWGGYGFERCKKCGDHKYNWEPPKLEEVLANIS